MVYFSICYILLHCTCFSSHLVLSFSSKAQRSQIMAQMSTQVRYLSCFTGKYSHFVKSGACFLGGGLFYFLVPVQ